MKTPSLCAGVVLFFVFAGSIGAQRSRPYAISGQIVIPPPFFDQPFEIRLLEFGAQPIDSVISLSGSFRFEHLPAGSYVIVADVPGFQPVRREVVTGGSVQEVSENIVLRPEDKRTHAGSVDKPVDFSGETDNVVDVAHLQTEVPAGLLEQVARASQELKEGKPGEARRRLEKVVAKAPRFYDARKWLGSAYQQLGCFDQAETQFKIAQELRPESAAPLLGLGSLYLQVADLSGISGTPAAGALLKWALDDIQAAVAINPSAAFGYYLLGVASYKSKFYGVAEQNLKRALNMEPQLGHARLALGNVYIQTLRWESALSQFDAYLMEHPEASDRDQVVAIRSKIENLLVKAGLR